jgi:hypothetical protein
MRRSMECSQLGILKGFAGLSVCGGPLECHNSCSCLVV